MIVLDAFTRKRIKPITCVKRKEEKNLSIIDTPGYFARQRWKKATIMILINLQAFRFNEKMIRNKKSKSKISKILKIHSEGVSMHDSDSEISYDYMGGGAREDESMSVRKVNQSSVLRKPRSGLTGDLGDDALSQKQSPRHPSGFIEDEDQQSQSGGTGSVQTKMTMQMQNTPAHSIYDIIHDNINKDAFNIKPPK